MTIERSHDKVTTVSTVTFFYSALYQLVLLLREPVGLLFGAVFSIAIVPLLGMLYGAHPTIVDGVYHKNVIAWHAIGINLAASAFITIPSNFAAQRSYGLLKLFRASTLSRGCLVLSFLFANMIFFFLLVMLLLLTNEIFYGIYLPGNLSGFVAVGLGLGLGASAMIPSGMLIAATVRSHNAVAPCGQLLFMPNLLLSGLSIPLDDAPVFLQHVSLALPLTHVGTLLNAGWTGVPLNEVASISWLVLGFYAALSILLICIFLRWE